MDREWLAEQLEAGRSLESIAREIGVVPSSVAYWANKHGLTSTHAARHAARGGIDRATLADLVEAGRSIRAIAAELEVSSTTVRHWLRRYGLATSRTARLNASRTARKSGVGEALFECPRHGLTLHVRRGAGFRCSVCRIAAVSDRRRAVKALLVAEAGGECQRCGYHESVVALQFHHLDPAQKHFAVAGAGISRSLARSRAEAEKCVLLCANCHAMVEAGVATLPEASTSRSPLPTMPGSSDAG